MVELPSFTFVNEQSLADSFKIQVQDGDKRIVCFECTGDMGDIPAESLDPVVVEKMERIMAYLKIAFTMQQEPMM